MVQLIVTSLRYLIKENAYEVIDYVEGHMRCSADPNMADLTLICNKRRGILGQTYHMTGKKKFSTESLISQMQATDFNPTLADDILEREAVEDLKRKK